MRPTPTTVAVTLVAAAVSTILALTPAAEGPPMLHGAPEPAHESPRPVLHETPVHAERTTYDELAPSSLRCDVHGRVVDSRGAPLPDATVALMDTAHRATTDERGRFRLNDVTAHADARLAAARPGLARIDQPITLWPEQQVDVGDIVLPAEARVRGRVVDEHGAPIVRARVASERSHPVSTDGDGAFELVALAPGRHALRAYADGFAASPPVSIEVAGGRSVDGVQIRLDEARTLSGRVLARDGGPVAGAAIAAITDGGSTITATCSDDGFFELDALPAGSIRVNVTHPSFLPFARRVQTGSRNVQVTLTRARAVFGRLVDARSGAAVPIEPRAAARVERRRRRPLARAGRAYAGPSRRRRGPLPHPIGIHATARVVVTSATHAAALSEPVWMGHGDTGPLVLQARSGARARAALVDDRGRPVPGAQVQVVAVPGTDGPVQTGRPLVFAEAVQRR